MHPSLERAPRSHDHKRSAVARAVVLGAYCDLDLALVYERIGAVHPRSCRIFRRTSVTPGMGHPPRQRGPSIAPHWHPHCSLAASSRDKFTGVVEIGCGGSAPALRSDPVVRVADQCQPQLLHKLFQKGPTRLTRFGLLMQLSMPPLHRTVLLRLSPHSPGWLTYSLLAMVSAFAANSADINLDTSTQARPTPSSVSGRCDVTERRAEKTTRQAASAFRRKIRFRVAAVARSGHRRLGE